MPSEPSLMNLTTMCPQLKFMLLSFQVSALCKNSTCFQHVEQQVPSSCFFGSRCSRLSGMLRGNEPL